MLRLIALLCLLFPTVTLANDMPFGVWVKEFKAQAKEKGIRQNLLDRTFANMTPNKTVIRLDRKQPEGTKSFTDYLAGAVTQTRISKGRKLYNQNYDLLQRIGAKYGVQPRFIIALWGIETNYGGYTGDFSITRSLATLAYDGRRSDFFRKELLNALTIIDQGHITLDSMKGSWAGALGQCQFMPSSFLSYAVDENGDGRKDIWNTKEDIFASIANYLSKSGWNDDLTWGRQVQIPQGFNYSLGDGKHWKKLSEWSALGITKMDGNALADRDIDAAITFPGEDYEGAYIIYRNYDVILKWNRSRYFATAVGTLSDRIAAGR